MKTEQKCYLCGGKGQRFRNNCSMCHDSTWDHVCDDGWNECPRCHGTGLETTALADHNCHQLTKSATGISPEKKEGGK